MYKRNKPLRAVLIFFIFVLIFAAFLLTVNFTKTMKYSDQRYKVKELSCITPDINDTFIIKGLSCNKTAIVDSNENEIAVVEQIIYEVLVDNKKYLGDKIFVTNSYNKDFDVNPGGIWTDAGISFGFPILGGEIAKKFPQFIYGSIRKNSTVEGWGFYPIKNILFYNARLVDFRLDVTNLGITTHAIVNMSKLLQ